MVDNLPARGGDPGLIPDPGKFHIAKEQLSLCTTTTGPFSRAWEPQVLKPLEPVLYNKSSHHSEKPKHHNWRVVPTCHNWRKTFAATKTQNSQKKKIFFKYMQ